MPEFMPGEDDFSVFKETLSPTGCHGSSWGLADLYDEWRKTLEKAFKENKWIEATWTCKKEIHTGRIVRRPEHIIVEATAFCDEDEDLITDAMWEMCKPDNELYEKLTQDDNLIKKILDGCRDSGTILGEYGYASSMMLPADATLEHCLDGMETVEDEAEQKSQENFEKIVDLIKWATVTK